MGKVGLNFIYGEYGKEIPEWAIDLSIPHNHETFIYFTKEILKPELILDTNYLKIDDAPVLYIWAEAAFFNQKNTYETLNHLIEEEVGMKLYIVADWIPRIPALPDNDYVKFLISKYRGGGLEVVNAYTGWIGFHPVGLDTDPYYYERHLRAWREYTETRERFHSRHHP